MNIKNTAYGVGYRRLSEDSIKMMTHLAPYFYLFIFFLIASYFIYYYYKLLFPYSRDLKEGIKEILYYEPEKYQTPFFAEYYIVTPVSKKSRVKISKEIFNAIRPGSTAAISYSIHSHFIFSIEVDQKEIKFNETNELMDR